MRLHWPGEKHKWKLEPRRLIIELTESSLKTVITQCCDSLCDVYRVPGDSDGGESAYNAGDLGSMPGLGR